MTEVREAAEDRFGKQYYYIMHDTESDQTYKVNADNIQLLKKLHFTNAQFINGKFPFIKFLSDVKKIKIKQITVYHGSDQIVRNPRKNHPRARSNNDYGKGFYTTEYADMADEWALLQSADGIRNEYLLDLAGLRVLDLDTKGILAWIAEVLSHRRPDSVDKSLIRMFCKRYKTDTSGYDIIAGYRADDAYFRIITAFVSNFINSDDVKQLFNNANLGKQIFLKSEKAFSQIKFTKASSVDPGAAKKARNNDKHARQKAADFLRARQRLVNTGQLTVGGITFADAIKNFYIWSEKDDKYTIQKLSQNIFT